MDSPYTKRPQEKVLFIKTIQNHHNPSLALLSDILRPARIESESMLFKDEVCDVNELILSLTPGKQPHRSVYSQSGKCRRKLFS